MNINIIFLNNNIKNNIKRKTIIIEYKLYRIECSI